MQFVLDIGNTTDPSAVIAKIMEALQMKIQLQPEVVLQFDQLLRDKPELILETPTLREAVERASHIAVLQKEQLGEQRGKQNTLLLLLRHKFADLPDSVTTHVQQTTDLAQLEAWTLQILTAQRWQEIFGAMGEAGDGSTDTR